MTDDLSTIKNILATSFIGTISLAIFFIFLIYNVFTIQDVYHQALFLTILMSIVLSFYYSGLKIVSFYVPFVKGYVKSHKKGVFDVSIIAFLGIMIFIIYLVYGISEVITQIVIGGAVLGLFYRASSIIWERLKKRYSWLEEIDKK